MEVIVTAKLIRQVTPPAWRIWLYGVSATTLAALANYGWLILCQDFFNWNLLVPKFYSTDELIPASDVRIISATVIAGLVGTLGATILAKTVIGPKIWWLIIGFGVGIASLYGALTLPNVELTVRLGLGIMHLLATIIIVIPVGWALEIRDRDLAHADSRYHAHLESKNSVTADEELVHPTAVLSTDDVARAVVGTDATDAITKIETLGLKARITKRDDEVFTTTFDFREDRINLEVANGTVVTATVG